VDQPVLVTGGPTPRSTESKSSFQNAPRLETERLVLRGFELGDLDAFAATLGSAEVMHHISGEGLSREDAMRRLCMAVGQWPLLGFGMWAVERKADGLLVGNVGLFDMQREMKPGFGDRPEMGWIFDTVVHGQGIAREACEAVLAWYDVTYGPNDVWAMISLGNEPSMKLAQRLSFDRIKDGVYRDEPIALFVRPAPKR
jgi:RimJ/RimL family protein N-acetyltransferase